MKVVETCKRQVALQPRHARDFQDGPSRNSLAAWAHLRPISPVIRLSLLGGMALHVGNREIALNNRKANALIAYLALAPGMKESRDRLAGLLWSESENAKAHASLRQLLHVVRKVFDKEGLAGFSADKLHVSLDRSTFVTDLDDAAASVDRREPADFFMNEMRLTNEFLSGYEDIDPSFGNWLRLTRECVRQHLLQGLEAQLADTLLPTEAIKRVARALLQLDPTHEAACQKLMRAYVESGNIAGALTAYKQLWECLEEEHDIEPSAATQEIVVAIKRGTFPPPINGLLNPGFVAARAKESEFKFLLATELAVACMRMLEC